MTLCALRGCSRITRSSFVDVSASVFDVAVSASMESVEWSGVAEWWLYVFDGCLLRLRCSVTVFNAYCEDVRAQFSFHSAFPVLTHRSMSMAAVFVQPFVVFRSGAAIRFWHDARE